MAKKVVAGLIIGGAIGSIVGKTLMEKHDKMDEEEDEDDKKDNGFKQSDV